MKKISLLLSLTLPLLLLCACSGESSGSRAQDLFAAYQAREHQEMRTLLTCIDTLDDRSSLDYLLGYASGIRETTLHASAYRSLQAVLSQEDIHQAFPQSLRVAYEAFDTAKTGFLEDLETYHEAPELMDPSSAFRQTIPQLLQTMEEMETQASIFEEGYSQGLSAFTQQLEQARTLLAQTDPGEEDVIRGVVFQEYDYILSVRQLSHRNAPHLNLMEEEILFLKSNKVEQELRRRAALSKEVLKTEYGYSDEAISVLQGYQGKPLEQAPEMKIVTASLYGTLSKSEDPVGLNYTWSWSAKPVIPAGMDRVDIQWGGNYAQGGWNRLAFAQEGSVCQVDYYAEGKVQGSRTFTDFQDIQTYQRASVRFPTRQEIGGKPSWARTGQVVLAVERMDLDGPEVRDILGSGKYVYGIETEVPEFGTSVGGTFAME